MVFGLENMISDSAYRKIDETARKEGFGNSVFCYALKHYQSNYQALKSNKEFSQDSEVEKHLLTDLSLSAIFRNAKIEHEENMGEPKNASNFIKNLFGGIFIGVLGNFVYTVLMVLLFINASDAMTNLGRSLGLVKENKVTEQAIEFCNQKITLNDVKNKKQVGEFIIECKK